MLWGCAIKKDGTCLPCRGRFRGTEHQNPFALSRADAQRGPYRRAPTDFACAVLRYAPATRALLRTNGVVGDDRSELCRSQFAQEAPRIDAGVVAVVEQDADGVVADRLDRVDADVLFADHRRAADPAVALRLSRRRLDAQQLRGKAQRLAVVEFDFERLLGAEQPNLDRPGLGLRHRRQSSLRASSTSMIGMPSRI